MSACQAPEPRAQALRQWLIDQGLVPPLQLTPLSGDASGRRYWRVHGTSPAQLAVDAVGTDPARFIALAHALRAQGLHAPRVYAADPAQGFLLIDDFGTRHYLDALDATSADALYGDALAALLRLHTAPPPPDLPEYDAALLARELELFPTWLLGGLLGRPPDATTRAVLDAAFAVLIDNALSQPQVWTHRDYHSRNLMVVPENNPGVLDFQDAVRGPLTYDVVSLLRDCYIDWPRERVTRWAGDYFARATAAGLVRGADERCFGRWFDLMGVQRHLKAAGIFARLALRDGKRAYLAALPRTLGYVIAVSGDYPELAALHALLEPYPALLGAAGVAG